MTGEFLKGHIFKYKKALLISSNENLISNRLKEFQNSVMSKENIIWMKI